MSVVDSPGPVNQVEPLTLKAAVRPHLLRAFLRDRTGIVGLAIVTTLLLAAALGPLIDHQDPNAVDVLRKFQAPSSAFPLGTDHLGRDVLARLLWGARLSLGSTLVAAVGISFIGIVVGLFSGYFGGVVDTLISRVVDVLLGFPTFLLALAVTGVLGPGLRNVLIAITASWWAHYARVVRSAVLAERGKPYIEAARALGAPTRRIIIRHLLPNILAPIMVLTTLDLGAILLGISAISFLGLGVSPPTPEWGAMLSEARIYLGPAPNMMLFPGAAIFVSVLGFNLLGDGLRDILDPRTRGVGSLWTLRRGDRRRSAGARGRSGR